MPTRQGSIHLFRLFGIDVYLHWAWFLVAVWAVQSRSNSDTSLFWNILEYLSLFGIVLMHEFGHQLACRQVGGKTHDIVLWPLGGVAYVTPPQRPGAMLWSIAAGPLVNVILFLISTGLSLLGDSMRWADSMPNFFGYVAVFAYINLILLKFNLLPIFPLDGGQILRSLLWFPFGQARSMMIAIIIGFLGVVALIPYVIQQNSVWYYALAIFVLFNLWVGFQQARAMTKLAKAPRRDGFACPSCHAVPPIGELWRCGNCGKPLDAFLNQAACPHCGTQFKATLCPDCGTSSPIHDWTNAPDACNVP
jgi:Zn-dependent protease